MNSKAYNLIWLSPKMSAGRSEVGQFYPPIPDDTVKNILGIAERNPKVDVRLWIDSKRLNEPQMEWLGEMITKCPTGNLSLQDLRTIPSYDQNSFYNQPDTSDNWRIDKHSLIWRQVDAARLLSCLQGDYEQVFYSDADVTNLNIESEDVQRRLFDHGVILSGFVDNKGFPMYENQMFGFDHRIRSLFNGLYERTIRNVMTKAENGYPSYIDFINHELKEKVGIDTKEVVFECRHDGTVAHHPDEQIHPNGLTSTKKREGFDYKPPEEGGWIK